MGRRSTNISIVAAMVCILLMALPSAIKAATMTFDSTPASELIGWQPEDQTYYIEDGIKMSLLFNHYDLGGYVNIDDYGDRAGAIKFEMESGSLFYLNSINVRTSALIDYGEGLPVADYTIYFSNGSSLSIAPGTNAILYLGINNLSYFTCWITESSNPSIDQFNFSLDNINLTPVPEPSALLLLACGLAGLVGYGRRRMKK